MNNHPAPFTPRHKFGIVGVPTTTVFVTLFATLLSACSVFEPSPTRPLVLGEHVAYRVINIAADERRLEMPKLTDTATGLHLYANLHALTENPARPQLAVGSPRLRDALPILFTGRHPTISGFDGFEQDPGAEDLALPAVYTRAMAVAAHGHRVPVSVALTWRQTPVPGQAVYGGKPVGPVIFALRAAIPEAVLARVRNQWRYRLDIEVAASQAEPTVRWRLLCFTEDAVHEIQRGGQWSL